MRRCSVFLACVLASLAFACATPFAAFAALAGAMLPLSAALPVVVAAWIINQAIGFGVLGYRVEMNTLLWGVGIGVAASIATVASAQVPRLLPAAGRVAGLALSLITAYTAWARHRGELKPTSHCVSVRKNVR